MTDEEWIKPSEELTESVEREAVLAAYAAIPDEEYEDSQKETLGVLLAFKAVRDTVKARSLAFQNENPGRNTHDYYLDEPAIVATAMLCFLFDWDPVDVGVPHAYSPMIIAFSNAMHNMHRMADLSAALDCEQSSEYTVNDAIRSLEKEIAGIKPRALP